MYCGISHAVPHLDGKLYQDPLKFQPSRFQGPGSSLADDPYTFTTFSHGLHACPGKTVAYTIMKMVMAVLLSRYELIPLGGIPPLDFTRATLAQRSRKTMVKYTSRV
mmetsp:Transcript_4833/g.9170  ORF Transcript_4833/g.9170 Transcript_4833/m.9170 type:complete len:107 (-) Transcript_4833:139-459(-)